MAREELVPPEGLSKVAVDAYGSPRWTALLYVVNRGKAGVRDMDNVVAGTTVDVPTVVLQSDIDEARIVLRSWCRSSKWARERGDISRPLVSWCREDLPTLRGERDRIAAGTDIVTVPPPPSKPRLAAIPIVLLGVGVAAWWLSRRR